MKRTVAFLLVAVLLPAVRADEPVPELAALLKKAAPLRPVGRDLAWREVPWHDDPVAAFKEAGDEKRPLFVWLAGGRDRDGTSAGTVLRVRGRAPCGPPERPHDCEAGDRIVRPGRAQC